MMRYGLLMEASEAEDRPVHALTHEILKSHGFDHQALSNVSYPNANKILTSRYNSERDLGTRYHDDLKAAGWTQRHHYVDRQDDLDEDDPLPAGQWTRTDERYYVHPDSKHGLRTVDTTWHPDVQGMDGYLRHEAHFEGRPV